MSVEPTRIASAPASSAAAPCARDSMPLSATTTRSRGAPSRRGELRRAVDPKRREVPRVDADDGRTERHSALELLRVVGFDERVEAERRGRLQERAYRRVVEVAQQEERRIGACFARRAQMLLRREEPFREERERRGRPRGAQVVPRAAEALVDEDRRRGRAGPLVRGSERSRVGVGPKVARRRRAALHLRDRGQAGATKSVLETSHHGDCLRERHELLQPSAPRGRCRSPLPPLRALRRGRPHARRRRSRRPRSA